MFPQVLQWVLLNRVQGDNMTQYYTTDILGDMMARKHVPDHIGKGHFTSSDLS